MRPKKGSSLKRLLPAISAILARHLNEADAAPELRRLALKHSLYRYRVFAAYRELKLKKDEAK